SIVAEGPDAGLTIHQLIEKYGEQFLGKRVSKEYGPVFPLLMKLVYCCGDLTLHVHTPDAFAEDDFGVLGREEFWYILDAPEGAEILTGFNEAITVEEFEDAVKDHTIINHIARTPACPGDAFYIPAGRPHSLTPGILLLEIFDPAMSGHDLYSFRDPERVVDSDTLADAADAIDVTVLPSYRTEPEPAIDGIEGLAHTSHFSVNRLTISGKKILYNYENSFVLYHCVEGEVKLSVGSDESAISLCRGESVVVAGSSKRIVFDGEGVVVAAHM
ncbi:MAG: class I mannose-6-phosphate isomerase, partial [Paramuribaculum sp.]|nr:class I mannose-6-phosphate isomerase [Paramuribaculum sp.]